MAATGRPKKDIDPKQVELLAGCFCTNVEIASKLGIGLSTLTRNYEESLIKGRESSKASLRVMQFQLAKKNAAMAIFLGKNYLGQKDRHEFDINSLTPEQALAVLKEADREDSGDSIPE